MHSHFLSSRRLTPLAVAVVATCLTAAGHAEATPESSAESSGVSAKTRIAGGGGYVSAGALVGSVGLRGRPLDRPVYDPVGGEISAFGFFVNDVALTLTKLTYCSTQSSALGKAIFYAGDASKPCSDEGYWRHHGRMGFGARTKFADFAVTDSPLRPFEHQAYLAGAAKPKSPIYGRGQPVQLPAVLSSVGIVYNNPDLGDRRLELGSQQLCEIYSGLVTNWNQIDETLPSRPIRTVFRSDNASTSFAFTNYLNTVCTGIGETFGVSETAWKALPQPLPEGASTKGFVAVGTNEGVARYVRRNAGTIGYVDAAAAKPEIRGAANFALLEGLDPFANLPEAASYVSSFPLLADVALGPDVPNGRPELLPVTGGAKPGCSLIVDPSASGFAAGGYPIVNVSYLLLASQGNGHKVTSISRLGSFLTDAGTYPAANVTTPRVTTIDLPSDEPGTGKTGYAAITPGSEAAAAIQAAALACVAP